jgi:aspartate aminotransferase
MHRGSKGTDRTHALLSQAKALLQEQPDLDHEYLSITGLPEFTSASAQLIFGKDSPAIKEGR